MPYTANIYRIFIASPGDVEEERAAIRAIITDWNYVNAASRNMFLEPIGWETHSVPEMGGRPQEIINKQILAESDILIGVFWTRIGTATGEYLSGTVEEIEQHVAAGKPALIYFSETPVRLNSVDDAQYDALRTFRRELQGRGLIESYSGISDFNQKFTRQLNRLLSDLERFPGFSNPAPEAIAIVAAATAIAPVVAAPVVSGVGNDAITILNYAAAGDGRIRSIGFIGGYQIQAAQEVLDTSTPRLLAKWKSALEELTGAGYVRSLGYEGRMFEVTERGYQVYESLRTT